jgi:Zn-dependent protease with chaperone function
LSGAGLLRVLLVLLITAHSMALFVFALRGADFAWAWARVHPPTFESVAIAAVCFAFTAVLTIRFFLLTAALLTARHDSADMLVEGIRLDPQQHEALFQHVADVARRLGAPVPHEVWISEEARCFSFEQRKFGFSTHRILVLVLGLPHLMILRADELAVIVGHELVHLRQQDTTLALFFFRFSQFLETSLAAARRSPLLWLNPCIWLEWVSFQLFSLLIAPVQRGQEIVADCRSAEAFGGDVARRTLIREWFVSNRFEDLVDQRLKESRLGRDNDPRTIYEQFRDEWQEISSKAQQFLRDRLEELEPQSYWDSHPTLKERLNAVSAYPNFGTDPAGPVAELLNTMDSLLRQISGPVTSEAVNDTVKMTARELQRPLPQRAPAAEEMG